MICKDCGKEFEISDKEKRFFEQKGLFQPKRCKECRLRRKFDESKDTPLK